MLNHSDFLLGDPERLFHKLHRRRAHAAAAALGLPAGEAVHQELRYFVRRLERICLNVGEMMRLGAEVGGDCEEDVADVEERRRSRRSRRGSGRGRGGDDPFIGNCGRSPEICVPLELEPPLFVEVFLHVERDGSGVAGVDSGVGREEECGRRRGVEVGRGGRGGGRG